MKRLVFLIVIVLIVSMGITVFASLGSVAQDLLSKQETTLQEKVEAIDYFIVEITVDDPEVEVKEKTIDSKKIIVIRIVSLFVGAIIGWIIVTLALRRNEYQ